MSDSGRMSTRRVYTGRVINVDVDSVRLPGGALAELEMVRHPGASAVVPFLSAPDSPDPQILLIRQYRYAAEGTLYEIPAGRLNPGEDPAECARRELLEETGCRALRLEHLTGVYTTPGFTDEYIHLYAATGLIRGRPQLERDEVIALEEHPLSHVLHLIATGEVKDGKTIVAILFAAAFRSPSRL